jgi:predicted Zn finger-like uncharacterized protein
MAGLPLLAVDLTDSLFMSTELTTRCPYCHTQFRVTPHQLALRDGTVRCGTCREIFNGETYLSERATLTDTVASTYAEDDTAGRITLLDLGPLNGRADRTACGCGSSGSSATAGGWCGVVTVICWPDGAESKGGGRGCQGLGGRRSRPLTATMM